MDKFDLRQHETKKFHVHQEIKYFLMKKANALKAEISIGKNALSEANILELEKRLEKRALVKVKVLHSVQADRKRIGEKLAEDCGAELVEVKGNAIVLWKKKSKAVAKA